MTVQHPAKFSANVITAIKAVLDERAFKGYILDPFAGVGGALELASLQPMRIIIGVELEPEWAACSPYIYQGDARHLPFIDDTFDAIITSPPYGNRMADSYGGDAKGSRRHTYRVALGRPLTSGSAAGLQWGTAYQETMAAALADMDRVLRPGGLVVLNLSNHIRKGKLIPVCDWYLRECGKLGWLLVDEVPVATPRNRMGANAELRASSEWLFVMETAT